MSVTDCYYELLVVTLQPLFSLFSEISSNLQEPGLQADSLGIQNSNSDTSQDSQFHTINLGSPNDLRKSETGEQQPTLAPPVDEEPMPLPPLEGDVSRETVGTGAKEGSESELGSEVKGQGGEGSERVDRVGELGASTTDTEDYGGEKEAEETTQKVLFEDSSSGADELMPAVEQVDVSQTSLSSSEPQSGDVRIGMDAKQKMELDSGSSPLEAEQSEESAKTSSSVGGGGGDRDGGGEGLDAGGGAGGGGEGLPLGDGGDPAGSREHEAGAEADSRATESKAESIEPVRDSTSEPLSDLGGVPHAESDSKGAGLAYEEPVHVKSSDGTVGSGEDLGDNRAEGRTGEEGVVGGGVRSELGVGGGGARSEPGEEGVAEGGAGGSPSSSDQDAVEGGGAESEPTQGELHGEFGAPEKEEGVADGGVAGERAVEDDEEDDDHMLTFEEFKKKMLEQAEAEGLAQPRFQDELGGAAPSKKTALTNYASFDCGAKVIETNSEAQVSWFSIEYYVVHRWSVMTRKERVTL